MRKRRDGCWQPFQEMQPLVDEQDLCVCFTTNEENRTIRREAADDNTPSPLTIDDTLYSQGWMMHVVNNYIIEPSTEEDRGTFRSTATEVPMAMQFCTKLRILTYS